jgi:O-antigen ligase
LIALAALSVFTSPVRYDSIGALVLTVILPAVCFLLGSQAATLRPLFIGAALGIGISSIIAIAQEFGWDGLPHMSDIPTGLFVNRNYMAEAAVLVAVGLIAERQWWFVPLVLPAALLPCSRGALLAFYVAVLVMSWRRLHWAVGALLVAIPAFFVYGVLVHGTASLHERWEIWSDAIDGLQWAGTGIGSFWTKNNLYHGQTPVHAHNDYIELLAELGPVGLVLLVAMAWNLLGTLGTGRIVLIAFAAEAVFGFPAHLPATLALGAVCAGYAARDRDLVRNFSWARRRIGAPGLSRIRIWQGDVAGDGRRPNHAV